MTELFILQFQVLNICLEKMSSEGEGVLEEQPAHPAHMEWVGKSGAILNVFAEFQYVLGTPV